MDYAKARGDLLAFIIWSRNTHVRQKRKWSEVSNIGIDVAHASLLLRNTFEDLGIASKKLNTSLSKTHLLLELMKT